MPTLHYMRLGLVICCMLNLAVGMTQETIFRGEKGTVYFRSDAPLELIEATSNELRGIIDPTANTFAFSLRVNTFEGFNSPLQQVHFNENYMETDQFPTITFSGKFIEDVDFSETGTEMVRAKGYLNVHGVEKERILRGEIQKEPNRVSVTCSFSLLLNDHDIRIPRIVHQKISERIEIKVNIVLLKESS